MEEIDIIKIVLLVISLVIAVVGHEIAHGWVAYKYGDMTAKSMGRLSFNPIKHIDILGTIIVPGLLYLAGGVMFGWAKPVPINTHTVIRNGGFMGAIWVALAGIIYNLLIVLISFLAIKLGILSNLFGDGDGVQTLFLGLFMLMSVNLILAVFNLYPIPPLDGSHALNWFLRICKLNKVATELQKIERYGFVILAIVVISPLNSYVFTPIHWALEVVKNSLI